MDTGEVPMGSGWVKLARIDVIGIIRRSPPSTRWGRVRGSGSVAGGRCRGH
jgi:hypothetical protein